MTSAIELNDPEYRWYHKKEMKEILTSYHKRKELGVIVICYQDLREKYLNSIREVESRSLDWIRFKLLVDMVPLGLDRDKKKGNLEIRDMLHFERRDACKCYICGRVSRFTQFHHIMPNGDISDENIVTLCYACHQMVHLSLHVAHKWKWTVL